MCSFFKEAESDNKSRIRMKPMAHPPSLKIDTNNEESSIDVVVVIIRSKTRLDFTIINNTYIGFISFFV